MYKNVLRSIIDIEIFPVIGLVIFMGFFAGLMVYVWRMSRGYVKHMEELPYHEDIEGQPIAPSVIHP
jgi:cytochrome c oxidase cbb3-type subunit IV